MTCLTTTRTCCTEVLAGAHCVHTRETVNMRMVANLPEIGEKGVALHHNGTPISLLHRKNV